MSEIIKTNTEYSKWIKEVSLRFRNSQIKAATKVNREMQFEKVSHFVVRKDCKDKSSFLILQIFFQKS